MSVDFPRAWEIAKSAAFKKHHPKCSYRVTKGIILCDCAVLMEHPETTDDIFQTRGGKILLPPATSAEN